MIKYENTTSYEINATFALFSHNENAVTYLSDIMQDSAPDYFDQDDIERALEIAQGAVKYDTEDRSVRKTR